MLKTLKISNFYSIGEEQELSFEIAEKEILDNSARKIDDKTSLNLVACVVGHNGSGKTNILKALRYVTWLVNQDYVKVKPEHGTSIEAHQLHSSENTRIELEFIDDRKLYKYIVELNKKEIVYEFFGVNKERAFSRIFECNRSKDNWSYISYDAKLNKEDEKRFRTLHNIPLLSLLMNTGYLLKINFFDNVLSNVSAMGKQSIVPPNPFRVFEDLLNDKKLFNGVLKQIRDLDLSISNFQFRDVLVSNSIGAEENKTMKMLECQHGNGNKGFLLNFFEESDGTQQSIVLFAKVFPILESGGIAILDELEDGLHPKIIQKIITLFASKRTNPNNAQLLFSTHQHLLLNDRTKTQIIFAEKNEDNFETEIYRLDEIEGVRNVDNYFHKYTAGTYGATPRITSV